MTSCRVRMCGYVRVAGGGGCGSPYQAAHAHLRPLKHRGQQLVSFSDLILSKKKEARAEGWERTVRYCTLV
jgi:hypothetical protein